METNANGNKNKQGDYDKEQETSRWMIFLSVLAIIAGVALIACRFIFADYSFATDILFPTFGVFFLMVGFFFFSQNVNNKKARKMLYWAFLIIVIGCLLIAVVSCGSSCVGGSGSGDTSKCTICRKPATHVFQGSGYCDEHYQDAIVWSIEHSD